MRGEPNLLLLLSSGVCFKSQAITRWERQPKVHVMPIATQNILSKISAKTSSLRLWRGKNSPNRNIAVGLDGIHLTALQGFYGWLSYQRNFSWLTKAELLSPQTPAHRLPGHMQAYGFGLQRTLHRLTQMQMLSLSLFCIWTFVFVFS